jgi:hypothetical protein
MTGLHQAASDFAWATATPPADAIRARGDRRRRRRTLASGLLVLALAGGGTGYLAVSGHLPGSQPVGRPSPSPHSPLPPSPHPAPSHASATMLPAGQTGPRTAVPWPLVGPGWVLAEYSAVVSTACTPQSSATGTITLYLIDPLGGRYTMHTQQGGCYSHYYGVVAWSGTVPERC